MKSIGVVRRLDVLGRLVLPKELRQTMKIDCNASMEILVDEEMIILKKHEPECVFCGNAGNLFEYQGKRVCADCAHELFVQFHI